MASGIVFTVNGAASALMYRMSEASGPWCRCWPRGGAAARAPALRAAASAASRAGRGTSCRSARRWRCRAGLRSASGALPVTATSQRLTNSEATEPTSGFEPGGDAPLDAAQIRLGGRDILLAGEQQRHVDRHAREDRLLDGGEALLVPGILMKRLGVPPGRGVPWPRRGCRPCRGPAGARPPATPSRPRRWSGRGSAGTDRRPASDPPAPARRTAPRPTCLPSISWRIASS